MNPRLHIDATTLARFCERHHMRLLVLFGSQLRGTARPDSDSDLLVELSLAWRRVCWHWPARSSASYPTLLYVWLLLL